MHQQKILFGSEEEEIAFNYENDRGTVFRRQHSFEGVIPNMERRYRDTESNSVREDLSKYMATSDCPDCEGTRLCESARNVFVDDKRIEDIVSMPGKECFEYFEQLDLLADRVKLRKKLSKKSVIAFAFWLM